VGVPGSDLTDRAVDVVSSRVDAGDTQPSRPSEIRVIGDSPVPVAVAHAAGQWFAFADACTHHECPLSDGYLEGTTIECDCHGSIFDLNTGAVLRGPAQMPIRVYATTEENRRLIVETEL
jgi:nitrite reductase/ring-hydroxylating ferredoxin subunit